MNESKESFILAGKPATFPGGLKAFYTYFCKNINAPRNGAKGRVLLKFIIEKDGVISNIIILNGIDEKLDAQMAKLLLNCPKWIPATQKGKAVRQRMTLPIRFQ